MMSVLIISLAGVGIGFVVLAAIGAKVIQEIAWHDLEEYCQRRQDAARFDQIHTQHDQLNLDMDALRSLGSVLFVISTVAWFAAPQTHPDLGITTLSFVLASGIFLYFLVSTWLPTALAEVWGTEILYRCWPLLANASLLGKPLSRGAEWMEALFRRVAARPEIPTDEEAFEDEVMAIVTEGLHDGHLGESTREMIEGVIELGDRNVGDIMTPRSKIDAMPATLSWDEALAFVTSCGRTRIPVHGEDLDDIKGVLYVKDLLAEVSGEIRGVWTELLREPRFVSKAQKLNELLQSFRATRNHLAMVQDEYGSIDGLVTIEDVLEEIVGEIEDESDEDEVDGMTWIDERTVDVEGDTHVSEVNERLGLELPEPDDFETLAGFVIHELRRIPKTGESLDWQTLHLTVIDADERRINRLRLKTENRLHPFLPENPVIEATPPRSAESET